MTALLHARESPLELRSLGALTPVSRSGGQGRVYMPLRCSEQLGGAVVIKLYRCEPPAHAARVLDEMVAWSGQLGAEQRAALHRNVAWPLATITNGGVLVGIAMQDVSSRFTVPFLMPSGRISPVMLQLEHLLGPDRFLLHRGLPIALDTALRARVAQSISAAFAFLHRHAIVVSDVSPSNILLSLRSDVPEVCLIDCDSMVFHGRQALASVETGDWQMPAAFAEPPLSRAADAYKLGLIVLRLFARSHDARSLQSHMSHVPEELLPLLARALSADAPNRPPAGEWQLALARTAADASLARHYPGPAPSLQAALAPPSRRAAERDGALRAGSIQPPLRSSAGPAALAAANARAVGANAAPPQLSVSSAGMHSLTLAWLLAGVLLIVLFAHLLQSAADSANAGFTLERGAPPSIVTRSPYERRIETGAPVEEESSRGEGGGAPS